MRIIIYPSGKEVKEYSWKEWQEIRDSKPPLNGVILSKAKSKVK